MAHGSAPVKHPSVSRMSSAAYRDAIAQIIRRVQKDHELNDGQLATRLACSASTIRNARTGATNLDAAILINIERQFGPGAIDPYLALANARAIPIEPPALDAPPTLAIVEALHRLIETQAPDSDSGGSTTPRELLAILKELRGARSAFDALILIADPPPASGEKGFRHKNPKRLAVVRTEGDDVAHARIFESRAGLRQ